MGWFWDRKKEILYVCPLPMCVFIFERTPWQERLAKKHVKAVDESCKKIGIDIKDDSGNYKPLIDVLNEISVKWNEIK